MLAFQILRCCVISEWKCFNKDNTVSTIGLTISMSILMTFHRVINAIIRFVSNIERR